MRKIFIILLLFINTLSVSATEWINIGNNLFLDKDSVRYISKNRTYKAWIKETTQKEIKLYFNEYNLKERIWRNLDTVTMDLQNNVKNRELGNNISVQWSNVVPDTNSYKEYEAVKKQSQINPDLLEKQLHID